MRESNAIAESVRYLLEQQTLVRAPARRFEFPEAVLDRRPVGGACITIAAADTRSDLFQTAEFQCDGSNDQVEWQEAIDFVKTAGGCIIAWPGNYNFSDSLTLFQIQGSIVIDGHGACIHHTSAIPLVGGGRWIVSDMSVIGGLNFLPTVVFDGLIFDADAVEDSSGIRLPGGSIYPHVVVRSCVFQDFDLIFIYGSDGLGNRFDILMNTFATSTITGGALFSPSQAAVQFNTDCNWAVKVIGNAFENIEIPAHFGAVVDVNSGVGGIIGDNNATNCSRTGGGGFIFTNAGGTNGVHDNWENGVWVP